MGWVAHVILESAQGPNPFFFFLFNFHFTLGPVGTRIFLFMAENILIEEGHTLQKPT